MSKLTAAALRRVVASHAAQEEVDSDHVNAQVSRVAEIITPTVDPERATLISEILGADILSDEAKVRAIVKAQNEISEQGTRMLRSAISMGRSLIDVKKVLTPSEFARAMRNSSRMFRGLSKGNVQKLMTVAYWWDSGRLPEGTAPRSYTTLYEFTTLPDERLQQAIDCRVFRPDVTRREVVRWKQSHSHTIECGQAEGEKEDPLLLELNLLQQRRTQMISELSGIRRRIRELKTLTGTIMN